MSALAGMRIGVVTPRLEQVGGTEIYVDRLIELQRELGATVHAFTAKDVELGESIHPLRRPDTRVVADSADRITAACDFVEFHGCAPLPLLRALSGRVPVILYQHTPELTCPAGGRSLTASGQICTRAPGIACLGVNASQRCLCTPDGKPFPLLQRLKAPLRGGLSRAALEVAWGVVFNSHALESLFARTIGVPGRSYVLPPMVPRPTGSKPERNGSLLFTGRLIEVKGVVDAIEACARIAGASLVIAGNGPAEARARQRAQALGIANRVEFRGWLGGPELRAEMSRARCLLVPSRWFETWGMVGLEAASHGCPVVAYDSGGVREWCEAPWGRTVPLGDVGTMAEAAREALGAESPGGQWVEPILARWGKEAFAARYAAIAQRAMERARATRPIRVVHLQRKPMPGFHSIEKLFATVRRELPGEFEVRVAQSPRDNGGLFKRFANLRAASRVQADVSHVVGDSHYLALGTQASRTVLTVHDCVALQRTSGLRRWILKRLYFTGPIRRAAVVTAISPKTVSELSELAGADPGRVRVVPCCVSVPVAATGSPAVAFTALQVGTLPHKNLEAVVSALAATGIPLHIVGELSAQQRAQLDKSGVAWSSSAGLDDAGMAAAYRRAGVLVFVSTYEGFGLPILEAQAIGLPVVTSALAPMDWVAGDGALLVDPADAAAIRSAVLRIAEDHGLRDRLREAGLNNVRRFGAREVALQYAQIYRELAG